jgi:tetratricopeptide (TPR) repeat protein
VAALPLLLLLLDVWPLRRFDVRAVVEKWPWLLLSMASGVITFVSHQRTAGLLPTDAHHWPLRAGYVLGFYVRKMVWPGELSCAYPSPAVFTLSDPAVLLACLAAALLTLVGVLLWRRTRAPLVGWLCFVLAIAPTLGLVQNSWVVASDKYVYFPALGVLLLVGCGLTAAWRSRPFAGVGARAGLLLALCLVLVAEARGVRATIRHWSDTMTLYRQMEKVAPASFIVQNQLGRLLAEASAPDEAIRHLDRAVELWPDYADAHYNLGTVLARQGKIDEAIEHLRKADALNPDDPPTAFNLGMALRLKGRLDEAAEQFARAVRLNPNDATAQNELGGVLVLLGRNQEAVDHLQAALARAPGNAQLHFRVASALLLLGAHTQEAVDRLREAIRLEPAWPAPYNALAWLLATSSEAAIRDGAEAVRLAARAVELTQGRNPQVLDTLAAAQAASGRFSDATETERKAIDLAATAPDSLVRVMRVRLESYQRGIPHTES